MDTAIKGIDVSHWQNSIDWNKVKASGIDFVILKAGGSDKGTYTDGFFEKNYKAAKEAGLHVGAYYFVGNTCTTKNAGIANANQFLAIIKDKAFEYPVFLDIETTPTTKRAGATEAAIAFCETMEEAGYYCGIYASDVSGFVDRLDQTKLDKFDKWVARYGTEPKKVSNYGMWQYSESGKVNGISGNVDLDYSYKDYPTIIKAAGLNGYFVQNSTNNTVTKEPDWKKLYEEARAKLDSIKKLAE